MPTAAPAIRSVVDPHGFTLTARSPGSTVRTNRGVVRHLDQIRVSAGVGGVRIQVSGSHGVTDLSLTAAQARELHEGLARMLTAPTGPTS